MELLGALVMIEWLNFAKEFGLPSAALGLFFWYVVIPLKDRHIKFMDKVEGTNDQLAGTIDKQADILNGLQHGLNQLASNQKETSQEVKKLAEIVEKLSTVQQQLRMP